MSGWQTALPEPVWSTITLSPNVFWVGLGCQRGVSKTLIELAVQQVFQTHGLAEAAIAGIATIDLKVNEPGLVQFCQERCLPVRYFAAAELASVSVPNPCQKVLEKVDTSSVAEAAAILASRHGLAASECHTPCLRVTKQIVRLAGLGTVTLAVA